MIGRITQVIGTMPDTTYLVSVTIDGANGELPAHPIRRPASDRYRVRPFEVGDSVALASWGTSDNRILYIVTPEDLDTQECA